MYYNVWPHSCCMHSIKLHYYGTHTNCITLHTVFDQMDVVTTIIFRSGKMRRLFKGSYCSRTATIRGCIRARYWQYFLYECSAKNMASQVDTFCFDSIVCGHHVYKTVWTLILREILTATYHASCHYSQSFTPCLRTCSCRTLMSTRTIL